MASSESTTVICARCKKRFSIFNRFARKVSYCSRCLEREAAGDVPAPQEPLPEIIDIRTTPAEKGFADTTNPYQALIDFNKPVVKLRKPQTLQQFLVRMVGLLLMIISLPVFVFVVQIPAPIKVTCVMLLIPSFLLIVGLMAAIVGEIEVGDWFG